jgi:teichuronic acid biosynthesis glycosyltransferase TuaG
MMPAPRVSILMPAFNAGRFIAETIESVRAQTLQDWQLLVVDDLSRDNTCAVVETLAARDPRIRLLCRKEQGGPAKARQTGLEAAAGRYLAFLDSDDLWLPEKLSAQLRFMEDQKAAFSYTQFRRMSENGAKIGRLIPVPGRMSYSDLLGNTAIATSSVILDRAAIGPFAMPDTGADDLALWLDILKRGLVAHGLQRDLMRYRVILRSVLRTKLDSARSVWRTYREVEGLDLVTSATSFVRYVVNALIKYRAF